MGTSCQIGLIRKERALWDQIRESFQAETAQIDLALAVNDLLRQCLADSRRVFESMA